MALAVDSSTPSAVFGNDPWTSASFTPPNNSVLLVSVPADWFNGTPVISVASTGLTFRRLSRVGANNQGLVEQWFAKVGSSGGSSRTVQVDTTLASNVGGAKVYVLTGHRASLPVIPLGGASNVTTNNLTVNVSAPVDGCWVIGAAEDWNNVGLATSTDTYESGTPGGVAPIVVRKASATATAGTESLNFDAAGSGVTDALWGWSAVAAIPDTEADPGIYLVDVRGTATPTISASASTAVDMPNAGSIATGNWLLLSIAMDNSGTSGAAPSCTITDPRSNTWTVVGPANNDPGNANAGSTTYLAYCQVQNAYTNGDDITVNHTGAANPAARAVVIEEWTGIDSATPVAVSATTATGTTAAISISKTPTATGELVYVAVGYEGSANDSPTTDTDTTDGFWIPGGRAGTTNATATNNQSVEAHAKLVSGTSAQSLNLTLPANRDWGAVAIVFAPGASGPEQKAGSDSGTLSEGAVGLERQSTVTDSVSASDAAQLQRQSTVTDSAALAEAANVGQLFEKTGSDSATVAETAGVLSITPVAGTDSVSLAEAAALERQSSSTDSAVLTESVSLQRQSTTADAATLADSAAIQRSSTAADSAALSEAATVGELSTKTGSDSATLTDAAVVDVVSLIAGTDTAAATDASQLQRVSDRSDSAALTETASIAVTLAALDFVSVTEQALVGAAVAAGDSAAMTDAAGVFEPPSVIERPFTGITARPSGGVTARPFTSTTDRPSSGTTTRPDEGITERP